MFSTSNLKYEIEKQIIDTGKAIRYGNLLFMTIKNSGTIDGWLYNFYLNKSVLLYDDIKSKYSEVADILVGELYQLCDDTEKIKLETRLRQIEDDIDNEKYVWE